MNLLKDFTKQGSRYQNLCQLKRHIAGMACDLGPGLDELFPHGPHRPILDGLGQDQSPQKVTQIVCQGKQGQEILD